MDTLQNVHCVVKRTSVSFLFQQNTDFCSLTPEVLIPEADKHGQGTCYAVSKVTFAVPHDFGVNGMPC